MEASRSKIEFIKPVILKAGIPLAVSVTCLVWSKIISTRRAIKDDDEEVVEGLCFETEASNMKRLVESLQEREQRLEMQFLRFCELKDREIALVEIGNRLKMEMERVEVLNREVSSMEAENQRMREYVKVLGEMKLWKLESRVLRRKMKKLSRTRTQQSDLLRESCRRIEAQEMEVSRGRKDMEEERSSVKKLEDDVGELRRRFEQMEMEKKEILVKLNSADQSAPSKTNDEALAMEEYSHMLKGMEHLQKEHEEEEEELVHLRWSNACLRHKLLRSGVGEDQEQTTSPKSNANSSTTELAVAEQNHGQDLESKLNRSASAAHATTSSSFHGSKRKKILQKLRKWVEGSDHQKVKHREIIGGEKNRKCFGQISVSDEAEEEAWIQESKEINVNGKVMCQDCTKGWNEWVNGTPIKGAVVSVTCMDERRRVIFYGSDHTDEAGLFSVIIKRYANGKQIKDKLCSVRLVSSPDQTCNVPTDFAGGCKGVKLSRPSLVFKDVIKYTIGSLYYTNPMCEKPDVY